MDEKKSFYSALWKIAIPVTLQSLLQSSFSVVDQIMTGQLGSTSIAGIGLGSKFSSIFSVLVSAIAAVAGIMIAQYIGKKNNREESRSFYINLFMAIILAVLFTIVSCLFPEQIMALYTKDNATKEAAASYLRILGISYLPMAVATLLSTLLRCKEAAMIPLYSTILAALLNTGLNYLLIFGKFGFPEMGVRGAAVATVISQIFACLLIFILFCRIYRKKSWKLPFLIRLNRESEKQYLGILIPIIACEFFWSLGENVYTSIYGHIGTKACAAMTLTIPIQVLMIGALSGLAQAAGIIIGKSLGSRNYERAYRNSKRLMIYGIAGSLVLSLLIIGLGKYYVLLYQVENSVRVTAQQILFAFGLIAPIKVQNMILGGGIIRSGGKTTYVMIIDFVGTWLFGVPLGLLAAFAWNLSIPYVYFILSLEECVRFGISLVVFKKKGWMHSLDETNQYIEKK